MTYAELKTYGKITVGKYSYGYDRAIYHYFREENSGINIGNFTSIAEGVSFILGGNHEIKNISVYPFGRTWPNQIKNNGVFNSYSKGKINIGSDVWISTDCKILNGVTIGDGSIIGAGSIVTKDVPPFSIYYGIPAKFIKKRFSEEQISLLQLTKWWNLSDDIIRKMQEFGILDCYDFKKYENFMKEEGIL